MRRRLCPPAAATSRARRARSWPRTSARSGTADGSSASSTSGSNAGSVDLAAKVGDDLREMPYGDGLDSSESDFRRRLGGAENSVEPGSPRSLRDRKRTGDRAYATVERELADRRVGGEPLGRKLARRREDGERDGKVEAGSLLAERRRCEIDRDPAVQRPFE